MALLPEREDDLEARAGRVEALHRFQTGQAAVLVASVAAALPRTIPPAALEGAVVSLYPQRIVSREELLRALTAGGYRGVGQVTEPGEFAIRGGILDCFPPAMRHPVRVEFFGDEVHSLRHFDPETQRSLGAAAQATLLPLQEFLMTEDAAGRMEARLRATARREGVAVPPAWLEALEQRRPIPEWDAFLPDLVSDPASVLAYLPADGADRLGRGFCPGRAGGGAPPGRGGRGRPGTRCGTPLPAAGRSLGRLGRFPPGGAGVGRDRTHVVRAPAARADRREAPPSPLLREIPAIGIEGYRGRITGFLEDLDRWRRRGERVVLVARSEAQGRRLTRSCGTTTWGFAWGGSCRSRGGSASGSGS